MAFAVPSTRWLSVLVASFCSLTWCLAEERPRVVIMTVADADNYDAHRTLPAFAEGELKPRGYDVQVVIGDRPQPHHFGGLEEALRDADALMVFVRRRTPPRQQLEVIKAHLAAGKPLVGVRTANHAFVLRSGAAAAGPELTAWPEFAPQVLGGHNGGYLPPASGSRVYFVPQADTHPILRGIDPRQLAIRGSLYQVQPLAETAVPLLMGEVPGHPPEPVAWIHHYGPRRSRVFYTSLGHEDDFADAAFRQLLVQGLEWALDGIIPPVRGLSRTQLCEVHSASGKVQQAPTAEAWAARREEAKAAFLRLAGPPVAIDPAPTLHWQVEEEVDMGAYVRQRGSYTALDGSRVPAYLCVPKLASPERPAPAVLCLHPTDNRIGHGVVVGLGDKANRAYAAELAERGFVTLAPSYPRLAHYQPDLAGLGYTSGTMKAIADNRRGLDLLASLPFVRHQAGYGAIGHSLGGHNSLFTAFLDERLTVIITSCGFDSWLDYQNGDLTGWTQDRYLPTLRDYLGRPHEIPFDFYELLAALAPRHVYINAPKGDTNFQWQSVRRIVRAARPIYALHGAAERLRVTFPEAGHDFPEAQRREAYALLEQVLGRP